MSAKPPAEPEKAPTSPPPPNDPKDFGPYTLVEQVGKGGMAQVFRARLNWSDGIVKELCIKRVRPDLCWDKRIHHAFYREASISAIVSHPNLPDFHNYGSIKEVPFIAMEFIDGFSLRQLMMQAARTQLWPDVPTALFIASEVLDALAYLHTLRALDGQKAYVTHRDVTPGNVMISRLGQIKLIDFGIAGGGPTTEIPQQDDAPTPQIGYGKIGYMSPEQATSMATDPRSDMYSAGIWLFELLSHRRLFNVANVAEQLKAATEIERPSLSNSDVPLGVDQIVLKSLAINPDDRFTSAIDFRDALLTQLQSNHHNMRHHTSDILAKIFGHKAPPCAAMTNTSVDLGSVAAQEMTEPAPGKAEKVKPTPSKTRTITFLIAVILFTLAYLWARHN